MIGGRDQLIEEGLYLFLSDPADHQKGVPNFLKVFVIIHLATLLSANIREPPKLIQFQLMLLTLITKPDSFEPVALAIVRGCIASCLCGGLVVFAVYSLYGALVAANPITESLVEDPSISSPYNYMTFTISSVRFAVLHV